MSSIRISASPPIVEMSSFRRKTPSATADASGDGDATAAAVGGTRVSSSIAPPRRQLSGTKPFLNGQTLISSGLAQLDTILGGGLLLGTMVLLETPRNDVGSASVALVDDMHRYFAAEGLVSRQCAMLLAEDAEGFAQHQLPLELSLAQKQVKQQLAAMDVNSKQKQQGGEGDSDAQLTIAWQYGKYLADGNAGAQQHQQQRFCHSFDLSKPIHSELLAANPPVVVDTLETALALDRDSEATSSTAHAVYDQLLTRIDAEIKQRNATRGESGQVVRVSMRELGSPLFGAADAAHMRALFAFVRKLRALISSQPVVCVLSGALYTFPVEFGNEIRHHCDYVLEFRSFMGENDMLPAELSEFHGLMDIRKLARVHSLACHSVDAMKYGIKRERRKLKIEKFHLPPEGSRSSNDTSSKSSLVGSSLVAKKSASSSHGSSCGSGGSSSSGYDPLAF